MVRGCRSVLVERSGAGSTVPFSDGFFHKRSVAFRVTSVRDDVEEGGEERAFGGGGGG